MSAWWNRWRVLCQVPQVTDFVSQFNQFGLIADAGSMFNLQLLAFLLDRNGFVIGHLHHYATDFMTKFSYKLFCSCLRIFDGIMQKSTAYHMYICDMTFVAKDIDQGNGVIDIGEGIGVLAALISVFVCCKVKRSYQQF